MVWTAAMVYKLADKMAREDITRNNLISLLMAIKEFAYNKDVVSFYVWHGTRDV